MQTEEALAALWRTSRLDVRALADLTLTGGEPALPSSFAVGTAAQASIAAAALAAAELWRRRGGRRQRVSVDMRDAAIECRSERYFRVDGQASGEAWDKIAGTYRCGDGRWVRLHTNFPHHRDGVLKLLGCEYDKRAVADALQAWTATGFEAAAAGAGLVVTAMRTFAEWDAEPQGRALATLPLLSCERIGDAPAARLAASDRPLGGVRVLDLTRVIAGPVCGRTLAAHGADVLLVTAAHLPAIAPLVVDTGRGKLSTHIDLRDPAGHEQLAALVREADVLVQGYRPGGVGSLGFGPEDAARLRPGIVYVSLSAYGHLGPWATRRGFDSLVQTASGFNAAEAEAAGVPDKPKPLPCQILDHATGYLMAFGAIAGLLRRTSGGGSWHVRASLAGTGRWLRTLGRIDGLAAPDPEFADVQDRLEESPSGFGRLLAVRHAAHLSETPPRWDRPSVPLGTHPPEWPR